LEKITIKTSKSREVVDITEKIIQFLKRIDLAEGLVHLFVLHTTAALGIADLDPGTDLDMLDAFDGMVPKLRYRHPHDPEHVPEHILSTLQGVSLTVPVSNHKAVLGTWQRIVLFEFSGPRERHIVLTQI
jgi:secondary thiamine-phosphate synthase enzyme